jgi:hypothetical protein
MNNASTTDLWEPEILGTDTLDDRFKAYLVRAPFDMQGNGAGLVDTHAALGGTRALIRGVLAKVPSGPISEGDLITLLARRP